ncbi:MAG: VRR-NUC domain-containing protein [Alphaproteobacteria bacterium]|nr:MAG: VRR-NUC domain-containing protein [Alphaproteobacteria bacterium]
MTEDQIHAAIYQYLRISLPGAVIHHSRNEGNRGGRRGLADGARGKRMGVRAGFPDLVIFWRGQVAFVEVKGPRGVISAAQRECRDDLAGAGFDNWHVCRSIEDAESVVASMRDGWRSIGEIARGMVEGVGE